MITDLDGSACSVPNPHHSYQSSNPALAPSSGRPYSVDTSKSNSKLISHSNIEVIKGEEDSIHGIGVGDERSLIQREVMHYLETVMNVYNKSHRKQTRNKLEHIGRVIPF